MTTILVSGFLPFGKDARNPSGEIARRLDGESIRDVRIESIVLPVERRRAFPETLAALERLRPEAVIGLGLASSSAVIRVERLARNVDDYPEPDMAGEQPRDEPIVPGGATTLSTNVATDALANAIRASGVPAAVSEDAGSYLCNHLFYRLLRHAGGVTQIGFLHVPSLPESVASRGADEPSMALETAERGVRAALDYVASIV